MLVAAVVARTASGAREDANHGSQGAVLLLVVAAILAAPRPRRVRLPPRAGPSSRRRRNDASASHPRSQPLALTACAATAERRRGRAATAPGFLLGLWHGFIFPVAWIVSLFADNVAVYAVPNNGGWYDFGYFLGIVVFGVGARKSVTTAVYRDRVVHVAASKST